MVAEFLGIPHLSLAVSTEVADGMVTVQRPVEGAKVTLQAKLPAMVTFGGAHAIWNPRYASLPGIMKAKKKPIDMKNASDIGLDPDTLGKPLMKIVSLKTPAERKRGIMIDGETAQEKAANLVKILHEEVKAL